MTSLAKQGGEGWLPSPTSFVEAMPQIWGDWGVCSEYGRLRAVLLHRPGPEIDAVTDHNAALWLEPMESKLARKQHDALSAVYRAHDVAVYWVEEGSLDKPNFHFVRDLMLMTPQGAIIARPASQQRAGEERLVAQALIRCGVPVLMTVHGEGTFEGADVALAGPELAFLAQGQRTNAAGAAQVEWALRQVGYSEVVRVRLLPPFITVHLDGVLSLIDRDLAMVHPQRIPAEALTALQDHGFELLEIPAEDRYMPGNFVALAPRHLVMPAGNPVTRRRLENAGCKVVEVDLREIQKSGGAMHCMTAFLKREPA